MSDPLTFAELKEQHVELLPARTVLSLISVGKPGTPGTPGAGGTGTPGIDLSGINFNFGGHQVNIGGQGIPGAGGTANPGH